MQLQSRPWAGILAGMLLVSACSDDDTDAGGTGAAPSSSSSSAGTAGSPDGGAGPGGSAAGGSGGAAGGTAEPEVIAAFDPAIGELPEGLALLPSGGRALVGFAPTGAVVSVDLESGAVEAHGKLPTPPPNNAGFMTGFAVGARGNLFGALVSFDPAVQPGVYRLPPQGGDAVLYASDPGMVFPNGIVELADGALLVTDSAAGAVFHVDAEGAVTTWASDELLSGQLDFCGPGLGTFDIGANGIAVRGSEVLVANNDRGSIVRIAITAEGDAGTPELVAGPDCDLLGGADGITVDADASVLVAVNRQNRIARVAADGTISVVAEGGVLDFPASLVIREAPQRTLLITSFALGAALSGGDPHPALVELPLE